MKRPQKLLEPQDHQDQENNGEHLSIATTRKPQQ